MDFSIFNPLMVGPQPAAPQPVAAPAVGPVAAAAAPASPGLMDRWNSWMQNPSNRAAMLQMGLQLMQPMGLGQTTAGHVGQAVGAGAEAGAAASAEGRKADLEEREIAARETTAGASMIRAQREPTTADTLTAYQQNRLSAAEQAAFMKFVNENLLPGEELTEARIAELAAQYESLKRAGTPASVAPSGPPPGAPTATGPGGKKIYYDQNTDSWVGM